MMKKPRAKRPQSKLAQGVLGRLESGLLKSGVGTQVATRKSKRESRNEQLARFRKNIQNWYHDNSYIRDYMAQALANATDKQIMSAARNGASMFDDFDLEFQDDPNYEEGFWTTAQGQKLKIKDMETSHIKNTIKYLESRGSMWSKIEELKQELANRPEGIIQRHEFEITEEMLIDFMKSKGIKLPKTGCGFYLSESTCVPNQEQDGPGKTFRVKSLKARWDVSKPLKRNHGTK